MDNASVEVLTLLSRALERAIRSVPNKPRTDITTADLAGAIAARAAEGVRDEAELAHHALQHAGVD